MHVSLFTVTQLLNNSSRTELDCICGVSKGHVYVQMYARAHENRCTHAFLKNKKKTIKNANIFMVNSNNQLHLQAILVLLCSELSVGAVETVLHLLQVLIIYLKLFN